MTKKFPALLFCAAVASVGLAAGAGAQQSQQPSQAAAQRTLWIAKFTCEDKAASAVASTQRHDSDALQYGSLFSSVTTFETQAAQPQGTWSLSANEMEYSGGSAAAREMIGYGAGRASITMEYKLTDPSGNVVWTQKIKTKPSWWGASGETGAIQNQRAAVDEQAQKLSEALSKYFGAAPGKKQ